MTTTALTMTTELTAGATYTHTPGWPRQTTLGDLIDLAQKKLGTRYKGVVVRTYGGGRQVEVLAWKDGYHGRTVARIVVYPLPDVGVSTDAP